MKKVSQLILLASSAALMSCGGSTCETSNGATSVAQDVTVEHMFVSEQKLGYSNMRPNYNYYETTFVFESLELYSDSTYKLEVSSCTFSALVIPEEGNQATGNARAKSLMSYYGKCTAEVDELDDTGLNITFQTPTRVAGFTFGSMTGNNGVIDTDAWTETMKSEWADVEYEFDESGNKTEKSRKEYDTGEAWLAAHVYTLSDTFASETTHAMDWIEVTLNA
ncbi:MAG: hypothetical protein K6B65_01410 [Bacilli bacterium]|nr:hypothetical protein [Bacilli bacterium]